MSLRLNWKDAGQQYALAMSDDSSSAWAHMCCGWTYLLGLGHRQEAVKELERAVLKDPLHLTCRVILATCLGAVGRFAEAEEHLRQTIDLDPNFFWAHNFMAHLYVARQMFAEAFACAEKSYLIGPYDRLTTGTYAGLLAREGQLDRAAEVLQSLGSGVAYSTPAGLAVYNLCRGEIELAADWFEKAIDERYPFILSLLQSAISEQLRASRRWPHLCARLNLPDTGVVS